ncbi:MAG: hypothetical protein H0X31_01325 [Nostocaceae cyanobacterium]|nr:hypothetical protein [Nostocaceae cyanobacterium]
MAEDKQQKEVSAFQRIREGWMKIPFFADLVISVFFYYTGTGGAWSLLAVMFSALAGYKFAGMFTKESGLRIAGAAIMWFVLANYFTGFSFQ